MPCIDCDMQVSKTRVPIVWYRWKIAEIGIIACQVHAKEILEALNKVQQEQQKTIDKEPQ